MKHKLCSIRPGALFASYFHNILLIKTFKSTKIKIKLQLIFLTLKAIFDL